MISSQTQANFVPLSPVSFLLRNAQFFTDRPAVIYGDQQFTYGEFYRRVQKLAAALKSAGIAAGDRVAVLAPNIPPMLEIHYAVPLIGAVLNPLNIRLDAASIGHSLFHADARLLICDREFLDLARQALDTVGRDVPIVVINDPAAGLPRAPGMADYEMFVGDAPDMAVELELDDEHQPLSVLYTSGTTATPKGVVYIHRGAYLAALSNALSFGLNHNTVYLWTWPMFHSHGLSFVWAVTAVGGTHVCLRQIDASRIFDLIRRHRVSHFAVAPTMMNMLANAPSAARISFEHSVNCAVGGAAPASSVISTMEQLGIEVTHQYGSTECYGPATIAWRRPQWDHMTIDERYVFMSRQGTPTPVTDLMVADPESMQPVARDGQSLGEVMLRGNTVMQGYFGDEDTSHDALSEGWFRTGDIAVWHPDGSMEIKDRSVDLIISESERISSVEIEEVLYKHPGVLEAAVVAKPDETLGEIPCAFVTLVPGSEASGDELMAYCQSNLADFKVPKRFVFSELPKTATGKIKKNELRELAKQLDSAE